MPVIQSKIKIKSDPFAKNAQRMRELLDEVTRIKLQAIRELTHEALRGDRMISIFLLQCGDLAVKIQAKLSERLLEQARAGAHWPADSSTATTEFPTATPP